MSRRLWLCWKCFTKKKKKEKEHKLVGTISDKWVNNEIQKENIEIEIVCLRRPKNNTVFSTAVFATVKSFNSIISLRRVHVIG